MQYAELGLADAGRIFEHRLEHRLQLAGRTADDLKDLGRRGLLLQRLGELLFQIGVGCAKTVNVSSRLRLRTKTGNAFSALRPFARQDHLVGTATGPRSGRPSHGWSLSILTEPHDELAPFRTRSPRRRYSPNETLWNVAAGGSLQLDVGRHNHLAPFLGFVGDELA